MSDDRLPLITATEIDPPVKDATVAGILLAAGTSSRFGERNKLLATVEAEPIVVHAARTLRRSMVDTVITVVGYEAERVRTALDGMAIEIVTNDDYADGQATSVKAGIEALDGAEPSIDAAIFALGDMPFVAPTTVDQLIDAFRAEVGTALAAAYEGQRGNPVVFGAEHFPALTNVDGDIGGRGVLLEHGTLVDTNDPGVVADIDTPADLDRYLDRDGP